MRLRYRSTNSLPRRTMHGQGLVEFALVLPVMILILLVAVDFGRLLFTYIRVNNAAREAASVASQNLGFATSTLTGRAQQESNVQGQGGEGNLTAGDPTCTTAATGTPVTCSTAADSLTAAGKLITVAVSEDFSFLTPMIGGFFPPNGVVHLAASATAPVMPKLANPGGGGGTPDIPCAVWATFIWSQEKKSKDIMFDPSSSTPASAACLPARITSYAWTWNDTTYATDDPTVLPSTPDVVKTTPVVVAGPGKNTDNELFHVALTVTATTSTGTVTYTVRQDVYSLSK